MKIKLMLSRLLVRFVATSNIFEILSQTLYELISKFNVWLKTLSREVLSEPECYGDLVYKFKTLIGRNGFSFQFRKIIPRSRRIGYNLNVMRQSACLSFNLIIVDNYAAFFNCLPVGRASDSMMARHKAILFSSLGPGFLVCCLAHRGSIGVFLLLRVSVSYSAPRDLHRRAAH